MNFFTYKIDNIREKIITMQLSTTVSHQAVHCSVPKEKMYSFIAIEEKKTQLDRTEKILEKAVSSQLCSAIKC